MTDTLARTAAPRGGGSVKRVLVEALAVALAGIIFALLVNQISPRGLKLTRDYLGEAASPRASANASAPSLADRLKAKGLRLAERAEVEQLFNDPRRAQHLVLFVDARDEAAYQEGHIPGAWEFYPFYPEKYLADLQPACDLASQIVVYCTGGDCEDSQAAALFLRDTAGVPGAKLLVYGGGITEWAAAGLPVEAGARDSGNIHQGAK